uniref:Ionotropic receptor n=1 Tax=Glyptapanteles indiensis TaxID=92994 RepID=B7S994_GLYIN|nr:hypothetical protein GIP_L7_0080 [Glyptapanteles indiensis]
MWPYKIILFTLFMNVSCTNIGISDSSSIAKSSILYTDIIRILEFCYADGVNPIAVTPNLINTIYQNLDAPITTAPILVLNNDIMTKEVQLYYPSYPLYILSIDTTEQLNNLLAELRSSPFWNLKSTIFVIGNPEKSCRDAAAILKLLWRFDVLSSYVLCSETGNQTMIYTLNPFTNRAPDPWTAIRTTNKPSARWTLYHRFFVNDGKLCDSLIWDRTKFFDGYPVKIVNNRRENGFVERLIFPSMNIIPNFRYFQQSESTLVIFNLKKGQQDVSGGLQNLAVLSERVDFVPVILEISFVIVTQKRNFVSSFREMVLQFDISTFMAIVIVILSFIVFLLTINSVFEIGLGFLDLINVFFNMEMDSPFHWLSIKIFFFIEILFMFTFGAAIEGQFLTVLSLPQSYKVESLKDLYTNRYHVYYFENVHKKFINEKLWVTDEDMTFLHMELNKRPDRCLESAVKDNTVACVFQSDLTVKPALELNLHVSQELIFKMNIVYLTREGWALKERFYKRILNFAEGGFKEKYDREYILGPLKKKNTKNRIKQFDKYHEVDEIDLEYIFIVVAFCQILAVVVFGIEYLVAWLHRRRNFQ